MNCLFKITLAIIIVLNSSFTILGQQKTNKQLCHDLALESELIWMHPTALAMATDVGLYYGLVLMINKNWSVMPGLEGAVAFQKANHKVLGSPFIKVFCLANRDYRIRDYNCLIVGGGPSFSFLGYPEEHDDVLFIIPKGFIPLQIGITCQAKLMVSEKWFLGVNATMGISQVMVSERVLFDSFGWCVGLRL